MLYKISLMKNNIFKNIKLLWDFNKIIFSYWKKLLILVYISIFSVVFSLVSPYLKKILIDYALAARDMEIFIALIAVEVFVKILYYIMIAVKDIVSFQTSIKIVIRLRNKYINSLFKKNIEYFNQKAIGEHLFRFQSDIDVVRTMVVQTIPTLIISFVQFTLTFIICAYISWKLTLTVLIYGIFAFLISHIQGNILRKLEIENKEMNQQAKEEVYSLFALIKLIKSYFTERQHKRVFFSKLISVIRVEVMQTKNGVHFRFLSSLLGACYTLLLTYIAGILVIEGRLSIGDIVALILYINQLSTAIDSFSNIYQSLKVGLISVRRMMTVLNNELYTCKELSISKAMHFRPKLEFRNVNFRYNDAIIFQGLDLRVYSGEKIAIIGPSGSGKTTIFNLIISLYEASTGEILLDGHNVCRIKTTDLKKAIGVVWQEHYIVKGNIVENIFYGCKDKEVDIEKIKEILNICELHEFVNDDIINNLQLAEKGANISIGQKQRLCIARSLYKEPSILLFDEITSSVSPDMEKRIIENIMKYYKNTTIVFITHNYNIIKNMDKIYKISEYKLSETIL